MTADPSLASYAPLFAREGISPLLAQRRVIGKFVVYGREPATLAPEALEVAVTIASFVGLAVERGARERESRLAEQRTLFAPDAASMGTWTWDIAARQVRWSDNLERIHGLPPGTFTGGFDSYAREIHPDDRDRVLASLDRAIADRVDHDVEYRSSPPTALSGGSTARAASSTTRRAGGAHERRLHGRQRPQTVRAGHRAAAPGHRERAADRSRRARAADPPCARRQASGQLARFRFGERGSAGARLRRDAAAAAIARIERRHDRVDAIHRNALVQATLVNELLDASRIASGKMTLELVETDLRRVLQAAVDTVATSAAAKQIAVDAPVPEAPCLVRADAARLQQVFWNVLSNAVKFTPPGGRIDVRAAPAAGEIRVTIADTGAGIRREFLPFIFDRFRQADA